MLHGWLKLLSSSEWGVYEGVYRGLRVFSSVWEIRDPFWCDANHQGVFIVFLLMTSTVIGAFGIV